MEESKNTPPLNELSNESKSFQEKISQKIAEQVARLPLKDLDLHKKLKLVATGVAATAVGLTLLYSCRVGSGLPLETTYANTPEPQTPTALVTETSLSPTKEPIITPTLTSTPTATVESVPPVATVVDAVPTPEPAETKEPADIELSGTISEVSDDPNQRLIKLQFPENLLDGENKLLPESQIAFYLEINSQQPIQAIEIPVSSLLGSDFDSFDPIRFDTSGQISGRDILEQLSQSLAEHNYSLPPDSVDRFKAIQFLVSVGDRNSIQATILNKEVFYRTPEGMKKINSLQEFERNGFKLINSSDSAHEDTQNNPVSIRGFNFSFYDEDKRNTVWLNANDFTLQSTSEDLTSAPQMNEDSNSAPESAMNWKQEWPQNQTLSFREWWDDMQNKGYIRLKDIGMHFRGEDIDSMIDNLVLIPKPAENAENNIQDSCEDALNLLVAEYGEYIFIEPEAYENIPGGQNCVLAQRSQN